MKDLPLQPEADGRVRGSAWLAHFGAEMMVIAATRYFIGRRTISTTVWAQELCAAWEQIPESARNIIRRDLEEAFRRDDAARARGEQHKPLGMDCDREAWEEVRAKWANARISAGEYSPYEKGQR